MEDAEFLRGQLERVDPEGAGPEAGPPPALVRVSVAQKKTIQPQRPIVGRLVEVRKVTVASEVTGKIIEMPVEEGTPVTDKTVLAQVDDVWSRLARDRCEAQIASIQPRLAYEEHELDRFSKLKLAGTGVVSESEFESKEAAVAELRGSMAETEAALSEERERITRSVILAPFDGTVVAKHAEEGGHVSPGDPIVDIVSRGQVDARLMVPESAINLIGVGQVLSIRVDPLGEEVEGAVVSVTPYGPTASRTFPVRVRLDDQGGRLKVGMSVTASIATAPEHEALVVSKDAVLVRPDGSTVWVAVLGDKTQDPQVQPVPVTISARMQKEYAVEPETDKGRELLVAGATVVIEGGERLMPGQQVRIITLDGSATEVVEREGAVGPTGPTTSTKAASGPASHRWDMETRHRVGGQES